MSAAITSFGMAIPVRSFGEVERSVFDRRIVVLRAGAVFDALWLSGQEKSIRVMAVAYRGEPCWMSTASHALFDMQGQSLHGGRPRLITVTVIAGDAMVPLSDRMMSLLAQYPKGISAPRLSSLLGVSVGILSPLILRLYRARRLKTRSKTTGKSEGRVVWQLVKGGRHA